VDLEATAQQIAERVRGLGAAGPLVLFALFALQCVVAPLPSEPLMMAGGYVYGPRLGGLIAWTGVVLGAAACFGLARLFGRPFAERFVRAERLQEVDRFVDGRGGAAVFLALLGIRVFAFSSFDVVSYGVGLIRFPFPAFLVATAVGVVPKVLAFTYLGANVATRPPWLDWVVTLGTLGILVVVPLLLRARNASPR
jgi:uncharacterized membrane protein YdjX (TVP38/TMEM64 family)